MGVERAAQIVDHALADADRRVVVQQGQPRRLPKLTMTIPRQASSSSEPAGSDSSAPSGRRSGASCRPAHSRSRSAAATASAARSRQPETPAPAPRRPASDRAADRAAAFSSSAARRSRAAARARPSRRIGDQSAATPANRKAAMPSGSAGMSPRSAATVSMMRCMSRPKPASWQRDHAEVGEPDRADRPRPPAAQPRISATAVDPA